MLIRTDPFHPVFRALGTGRYKNWSVSPAGHHHNEHS